MLIKLAALRVAPVAQLPLREFSLSAVDSARRWREKNRPEYESEFHNPVRQDGKHIKNDRLSNYFMWLPIFFIIFV